MQRQLTNTQIRHNNKTIELRKMKVTISTWVSFVLIIVALLTISPSTGQNKVVYLISLKEEISGSVPSFIDRSLRDAKDAGANAVILEINTLGGRLDASVEVRDNILNCKIPTIAFINRRAISAGALISLAADKIIMAPGATIGASTPVNFLGEKASEKVISFWRAEMRATAEKNNRPIRIADAMVDEAVEIPGLIEKGKLLTLTTEEALKHKLADYQAEDIDDLLKRIEMSGAQVIRGPTMMDNIKEWVKPEIVWSLIGLVLLILEFSIPGVFIVFFGIGACITAIVCIFTDVSLNAQLTIFIISSVVLLLFFRKWFKRALMGRIRSKQNATEDFRDYIGEKAIVTEQITRNEKGKVEFRGTAWEAESNETIPVGASVKVIGRNNITLIVASL
jgi:membrane-bound serine protease (ClpP class)